MPTVIYVPKKMTGYIRCPTDASPPVTWVKWEKDGFPLRIEKVLGLWLLGCCVLLKEQIYAGQFGSKHQQNRTVFG